MGDTDGSGEGGYQYLWDNDLRSGAFPVIVDTGCHAAVASVVDRCS
jgi:hypothetical protein